MTPTEAHAKAVEAAARGIYEILEGPIANQDFNRQRRQWELAQKLAAGAIRAYHASLRETVGAGVYVVPGDVIGCGLPCGWDCNTSDGRCPSRRDYNAALATVRAARIAIAEPPADG
jgi:hypothetical protein